MVPFHRLFLGLLTVAMIHITQASRQSACSGKTQVLRGTSGSISTPGYPTGYPSSLTCRWHIIAPQGSKVVLTFKNPFGLERAPNCAFDSLTIFEGNSTSGTAVGRFCNSNPPARVLRLASNSVLLVFVSDKRDSYLGFTLDYSVVEETNPCTPRGQVVEGEHGFILSPNHPRKYHDDMDCSWLIQAPEGARIRLDFLAFSLELEVDCPYDYLLIFDGATVNATSLGRYCGQRVPADMTSSGHQVLLKFHSDGSIGKTGFKIEFTALAAPTPAPSLPSIPSGPQNTPNTSRENVTVPNSGPRVDLNCQFEEGNMCMWRRGAGGQINWQLRRGAEHTFIINDNSKWGDKDHTTGSPNGHYIVIEGNTQANAGDRGYLISPQLSPGGEGGRCLTLWYNMYYTKGRLQVIMRREDSKDEVIWQRDGNHGNGWHKGVVSLVSSEPYRVVLVGSRGTSGQETGIAVDDISFLDEPCLAVPLECGLSMEPEEGSQPPPQERPPENNGDLSLNDLLKILFDRRRELPAGEPLADGMFRRVVGGQTSTRGMWPWMVAVRTLPAPGAANVLACGGSLIDRRWVLTAAHCFEYRGKWITDPAYIQLKLGELNIGEGEWDEGEINLKPAKVIIHPQRTRSSIGQVSPWDVALVKLPHAVHLSDDVNVVCLPSANTALPAGTQCAVSGWGATETSKFGSNRLLHVDLKVISNSRCSGFFGEGIGRDLVCAKHDSHVKSACQGDSGGPLVCRRGSQYMLAGVVSWGVPCSLTAEPLPSVFSRVTFFLPWIQSTMNSEQ